MDAHPWTKYEIARIRDEERFLRAGAAGQRGPGTRQWATSRRRHGGCLVAPPARAT
jgi:hypothetical protein